jgi:hypothetical protein
MKLSSAFSNLGGLLLLSLEVAALAHNPRFINFKIPERHARRGGSARSVSPGDSTTTAKLTAEFPQQWFTQSLDHFSQASQTFKQRFWVNKRHYVPGSKGPVVVIDGGETSGEDRLPFLDTGIAEILARATGGIGVVLEHRYVWTLYTEISSSRASQSSLPF